LSRISVNFIRKDIDCREFDFAGAHIIGRSNYLHVAMVYFRQFCHNFLQIMYIQYIYKFSLIISKKP